MLKKVVPLFLCISTLFFFAGCKSNSGTEDDTSTDGTSSVATDSDDGSDSSSLSAADSAVVAANKQLLDTVRTARSGAVSEGANRAYSDAFNALEEECAQLTDAVNAEDGSDYSLQLRELANKYRALERLAKAKDFKQKIDDNNFADSDVASYTAGAAALEATEKLLSENADGTELLAGATTAYNSFKKILETKFATLAKEERIAAFNAKKKADDVRCAVAAKAEYNAAVDAFRKGDSAFVTSNPEGAYESYHTAKESFLSMADDIGVKRAEAQAAIERAKSRTQASNAAAKQADKDAPLGDASVKGIEAEDAVLLETTTFDNPESAEADIPEEIQEAN